MLITLFIALACWCWLGRGPYFLRWPSVILILVITSGHPLANVFGPGLEEIAAPLLPILIAIFGLFLIFRGIFGSSRRRHHDYGPQDQWQRRNRHYGERRDRYDRW